MLGPDHPDTIDARSQLAYKIRQASNGPGPHCGLATHIHRVHGPARAFHDLWCGRKPALASANVAGPPAMIAGPLMSRCCEVADRDRGRASARSRRCWPRRRSSPTMVPVGLPWQGVRAGGPDGRANSSPRTGAIPDRAGVRRSIRYARLDDQRRMLLAVQFGRDKYLLRHVAGCRAD